MRQFNISPESYVEQVKLLDIPERRKDENVIVCENGVVFKRKILFLKRYWQIYMTNVKIIRKLHTCTMRKLMS